MVAALSFSGLALLLHIIGFSVPYWYSQEIGSSTVHMGLWKGCFSTSGILGTVCKDYSLWDSDLEYYHRIPQGLTTIALILASIGCFSLIAKISKGTKPGFEKAYLVATTTFGIADVLIAIALVIWSLFQTEAVRNNKSYGFWLEIFAAVLFFLSEIILYLPINAPDPVVYPAMPQTVSYITTQQQSYQQNW
ncbi:unnamed protein product [Mytilus coruscus]|uniref:Uncharacterized protein n=1 Tax=Mytilus coruscus TaxID=42192 RepID=A0A6J8C2Z6_MYTCO|nr:unnamed protein product [Mytilus coruscus]